MLTLYAENMFKYYILRELVFFFVGSRNFLEPLRVGFCMSLQV